MHCHPHILTALGRLRAEELTREAAEHRATRRAIASIPRRRGARAQALAWWRSSFQLGRSESAPLAEPEES
jgi:hypothetical protein